MQHVRDTFDPDRVYKHAEDARADLTRLLRSFFESSQAHVAGGGRVAPALAAAVTPGLGKTGTTLRLLAEFAPAFLSEGHVAVYVPTLDLADRAYADFVCLAPDVPARVLRGRDAGHPLTGVRMCERPEIARRIAPVVPSITGAICERARGRRAPCAVACPYLEQRPDTHSVLFLAHSYLTAKPPVGGPVVLQIVDEKVWPALIGVREVTVEDWLLPPAAGLDSGLEQHYRQARYRAVEALQTRECPIAALRSAGLTAAVLGALAAHEFETAPSLDLRPDMPRETTRQAVEKFDFNLWALRTGRGQILRYLARALDTAASARLTLATRHGSDARRQVLRLHKLHKLDPDIPTLFLDADADPAILEQIRPGTRHVRVTVAPKATVVQAVDRTLSNAWLLDKSRGKDRMDSVLRIVRREVEGASPGRVLLVATKDVLHALHVQATGIAPRSPEDLLEPLLGAHPRWFGPRLQGVNDYEDFDTVLLVGRLQPPVEEVERCARCVFGDADSPLSPIERPIFPQRSARRVLKSYGRKLVMP